MRFELGMIVEKYHFYGVVTDTTDEGDECSVTWFSHNCDLRNSWWHIKQLTIVADPCYVYRENVSRLAWHLPNGKTILTKCDECSIRKEFNDLDDMFPDTDILKWMKDVIDFSYDNIRPQMRIEFYNNNDIDGITPMFLTIDFIL